MRMQPAIAQLCVATTILLAGVAPAQAPELVTRLDYSLNASRDVPIACKQGDIERFPGKTLAQVFGDQWPLQPEPEPGSERVRAQMTTSIRLAGALKGAPAQPGLVVFAALVDASGKALRVEVLCATTEGYDKITRRMALRSEYKPAAINGAHVTSVVVQLQKYGKGGG